MSPDRDTSRVTPPLPSTPQGRRGARTRPGGVFSALAATALLATVPALSGVAAGPSAGAAGTPTEPPAASPSGSPSESPEAVDATEPADASPTPETSDASPIGDPAASEAPGTDGSPAPIDGAAEEEDEEEAELEGPVDVTLTRLGVDPFVDGDGAHQSVAEVDGFHFGSTIVAVGQAGPYADGGASAVVFATSGDNGVTWTRGVLPGLTRARGGPYERVGHPVVSFDARHETWLVSSLAFDVTGSGVRAVGVVVSRSTDGGHTWSAPVLVGAGDDPAGIGIACDNTPSSPFHGTCYSRWSDRGAENRLKISRSPDGGRTWHPAAETGDRASGIGGRPVVQRDGTVIVPVRGLGRIRSFRSTDGGTTWRATVPVADVREHDASPGTAEPPAAGIDAAGRVYVVWRDCRFRDGCTADDIVMSTSTNGNDWGPVTRVTGGRGDHFGAGIGVDRSTSAGSARLAVVYHRRPGSGCAPETCRITVEYVSSHDGGASWSHPIRLAGPMRPAWLAGTAEARATGGRVAVSVVPGGNAFPVFSSATANAGTRFAQHMFTVAGGLPISGGTRPAEAEAVPAGAFPTPG